MAHKQCCSPTAREDSQNALSVASILLLTKPR